MRLVIGTACIAMSSLACTKPPTGPALDRYNYVLGTQTIGPLYQFTKKTILVETAEAIRAVGSNVLKISLEKDYARKQYRGLPDNSSIRSLVELARDEPSYRAVLDMPFAHYLLWAYPFDVGWWDDGLSKAESDATYRQMRDLTEYLLRRYNGTGKIFYLGHWEGDWHLLKGYDTKKDPAPEAINGMIAWLNIRQKAIEDARKAVRHRNVEVYGYAEVNLGQKAMQGGRTVTNDVLPATSVDFVSYSSYDSLAAEPQAIAERLPRALDYIESKLKPKPSIPSKRVFIGEYGFPARNHTPERQDELSRAVCSVALTWGCRFALYWEMYCNEAPNGKHNGFWMIDEKGAKQPVYHTHERFYREARALVARFQRREGRLPSRAEFGRMAAPLLAVPRAQ